MSNRIQREVDKLHLLLDMSELTTIVPYSPASIYRKISKGEFPAPLKLGKNRSAWRLADVQQWIDSRPQPLAAA